MKKIKILAITIAIIFSTVYALNLEYFIKGIRVVYLNGQTTVFIDDLKYFDYETIMANDEKFPWNESENLVDTFSDEFEQINKEFGTVAYVVSIRIQLLPRNIIKDIHLIHLQILFQWQKLLFQ
jgi:hypothetical protein